MHATGQDETHRLQSLEADLVKELSLAPAVVHEAVLDAVSAFDSAPVRDFVPVLAGREVRRRLRPTA